MNFNSLRKEIISNNASVKELVKDFFSKIDNEDPEINSYICTTKDNAIAQADNIDKLIQNKEKLPPLAGMPIAIKDNICTKGVVTTCASNLSSISVFVNLTAFLRMSRHKSISFSPNSASSGILSIASDTILDAIGNKNENIVNVVELIYIAYFSFFSSSCGITFPSASF